MDKDKYKGSSIVALRLPDDTAKAVGKMIADIPGAVKAEELHATMAYLGNDLDDDEQKMAETVVKEYAAKMAPLGGMSLEGTGTFKMGDHGTPFYAKLRGKGLMSARQGLADALTDAGVKMASNRTFKPHVTLAYLPKGTQTPELDMNHTGLSFGALHLKCGGGEYMRHKMMGERKATDITGIMDAVQGAWAAKQRAIHGDDWWSKGQNIERVRDDSVIVKSNGKLFSVPFVIDQTSGDVTFGEQRPVVIRYVDKMLANTALKACTPEQAKTAYLKMCGERHDDDDTRVVKMGDDYLVAEKAGAFSRVSFSGDEGDIKFGEPEDIDFSKPTPEPDATKAGRRMSMPNLTRLRGVRDDLTDAVAKLTQVIGWGEYTNEYGKSLPDYLNIDLLAEWVAEAKSLPSIDIPPMYLKAIKETPKGVVVGGYMAPWGSPLQRDLQGDYATKDTNFYLENFPNAPCMFQHGQDPKIGKSALGQRDDAWTDDDGLWVQDYLNKSSEFWGIINALLERKALYYSPGAVPHLVERSPDKELLAYPIADDTMTVMPVQAPLMVGRPLEYIKSAYKSIGAELPELLRGVDGESTTGDDAKKRKMALTLLELRNRAMEVL